MKKLVPILTILFYPLLMVGQSKKVKIYAFQQEVLPGTRRITIDESGQTREIQTRLMPRTFIYLEAPRDKQIEPKHVWIDGKLYGVRVSTPQLPVIMHGTAIPEKGPDTLVRKTRNQVLQLEPITESATFTPTATAKRKMKSNKIVLHTIENGKNCYYYLNDIKNLDPVALQ